MNIIPDITKTIINFNNQQSQENNNLYLLRISKKIFKRNILILVYMKRIRVSLIKELKCMIN